MSARLGLVSTARDPETTDELRPFLTVQVQLWARELRRLLREVAHEPTFAWADALPEDAGPGQRRFLPIHAARPRRFGDWNISPGGVV